MNELADNLNLVHVLFPGTGPVSITARSPYSGTQCQFGLENISVSTIECRSTSASQGQAPV